MGPRWISIGLLTTNLGLLALAGVFLLDGDGPGGRLAAEESTLLLVSVGLCALTLVLILVLGQTRQARLSMARLAAAMRTADAGLAVWRPGDDRWQVDRAFWQSQQLADPHTPRSFDAMLKLMHPADAGRFRLASNAAIRHGDPLISEFRLRRACGAWGWFLMHARPHGELDRGRPLLVGMMRNIQAQRDEQEQQQRTLIDLAEGRQYSEATTAGLVAENRRLERELVAARDHGRVKTAFFAGMGHTVRATMTSILGYAELLLEAEHSIAERQGFLATLRDNSRELLDTITQTLHLAELEAGALEVNLHDCDLAQLVRQTAEPYRRHAADKQLNFQLTIQTPQPLPGRSDPKMIARILKTLLDNAVKYTDEGQVTITARQVDETGRTLDEEQPADQAMLRVDVADTGMGMTPRQQRELFDPMTAMPILGLPGHAEHSGSWRHGHSFKHAVHLAVARALAQLLGGSLSVRSQFGQGSCFTWLIPLNDQGRPAVARQRPATATDIAAPTPEDHDTAAPDVSAGPSSADRADAEVGPRPRTSLRGRVLIAEDGEDERRLFERFLSAAGLEVTAVPDGQQAMDAALDAETQGSRFDLLLLDLSMPYLDGLTAARSLRQLGWQRPICALTAHASAATRQQCLDAGISCFVTKPISRDELVNMVSHQLQRQRSQRQGRPTHANVDDPMATQEPIYSEFTDDEQMMELVAMFVDELPQRIAKMEEAYAANDLQTVQSVAHQMKGAAGGYGFPQITDAALQVEDAARAGSFDDTRLAVDQLAALCDRATAQTP